jgi:3-isopropylmalate/(R)-2-methylmalate dehydratase small subunit
VEAVLDLDMGELRPLGAAPVALEPLPDNLKTLLADGGLVPHLKKRFAAGRNRD